jgi:hypothetical protein
MATMIVHGGDNPTGSVELRGVLDRALALPESLRLAFLLRELNREPRDNT